jgi:hypothetical protein
MSKTCLHKRTYPDKGRAKAALYRTLQHVFTNKDSAYKTGLRAYQCPDCGAWHLTSMTLEQWKQVNGKAYWEV